MASKQAGVDFVVEQLSSLGDVSARKMFGEFAIYYRGKLVALFCDDELFVKPTSAGRSLLGKPREQPPYPGAKPYFLITGDRCEDADFLCELVSRSAAELPSPKPKAAKKSAKKSAPKPKRR
jgi:TfoX/Sxy family transcriptional regulator of competence genes